jgi:uncharacterized damage-inducible protein DinB
MNELLAYFDRIRARTMRVVAVVPPERIDWTYKPGKFTFGDVIRHLGAIERWMYAENAQLRPSRYTSHGRELADGYDGVVAYIERMHAESMAIFAALTDADLDRKCITPGGAELSVRKWLRAMIEHEVHHRGQLYLYCSLLDIPTPPLYGLTSEEVARRAAPGTR